MCMYVNLITCYTSLLLHELQLWPLYLFVNTTVVFMTHIVVMKKKSKAATMLIDFLFDYCNFLLLSKWVEIRPGHVMTCLVTFTESHSISLPSYHVKQSWHFCIFKHAHLTQLLVCDMTSLFSACNPFFIIISSAFMMNDLSSLCFER